MSAGHSAWTCPAHVVAAATAQTGAPHVRGHACARPGAPVCTCHAYTPTETCSRPSHASSPTPGSPGAAHPAGSSPPTWGEAWLGDFGGCDGCTPVPPPGLALPEQGTCPQEAETPRSAGRRRCSGTWLVLGMHSRSVRSRSRSQAPLPRLPADVTRSHPVCRVAMTDPILQTRKLRTLGCEDSDRTRPECLPARWSCPLPSGTSHRYLRDMSPPCPRARWQQPPRGTEGAALTRVILATSLTNAMAFSGWNLHLPSC